MRKQYLTNMHGGCVVEQAALQSCAVHCERSPPPWHGCFLGGQDPASEVKVKLAQHKTNCDNDSWPEQALGSPWQTNNEPALPSDQNEQSAAHADMPSLLPC